MWNPKKSVKLSIFVCTFLCALLLVLILFGPQLFEFYMTAYRGFSKNGEAIGRLKTVFCGAFYPSAVFASVILYSLIRLLFNIKDENIFIPINSVYLKRVSWCCFAIAVITFIGGLFYMPFMFVSAAGGFVGMLLRVLKNIMQTATAMREENDLTI